MNNQNFTLKRKGCNPYIITEEEYETFRSLVIEDRKEKAQQAVYELIQTIGKGAAQDFIETCIE